jgi:hypothetical protein
MKRIPTTNPKIDGQPMSFVRLGSRFQTPLRLVVRDERSGEMVRLYTQDVKGTVRRVTERDAETVQVRT